MEIKVIFWHACWYIGVGSRILDIYTRTQTHRCVEITHIMVQKKQETSSEQQLVWLHLSAWNETHHYAVPRTDPIYFMMKR